MILGLFQGLRPAAISPAAPGLRSARKDSVLANIKSAEKQNRQRIKREARNKSARSEVRTAVKKLRAAITSKDAKKAGDALAPAIKLLDRAGRRGEIERNASARSISRLTRAVSALK